MSEVISFDIQANPMASWKSWGHNQYPSVADVIAEFVDNALQSKTGKHGVHIRITSDSSGQRWITIEDGGTWAPITAAILQTCFGYGTIGDEKKVGLNEHNCGLKNSLAYLDTTNSRWIIQIRQHGVIWELKAPYDTRMSLTKSTSYLGELTSPNSTFIRVPLDDTQFKTLYERSVTTKANDVLLTERLRMYLASMWMMRREIATKDTPLYFNGEQIVPYSFDNEPEATVLKYDTKKAKLGDYSVELEVRRIYLLPKYPKDHPIFKRSIEHSGAFIFRDGRLINKSPLFKEIYGKVRDGHYCGWMVIVNVAGEPRGLPETCTTKNGFSSQDPKIDQLYALIREICSPDTMTMTRDETAPVVERELVRRLAEIKKRSNERRLKRGVYDVREEVTLDLHTDGIRLGNKDRIDMLEIDTAEKVVTIWEAKRQLDPVPNLRQLSIYYRNIKHFCTEFRGYDIECKLIIPSLRELPSSYTDELVMLQKHEPDFNPVLEDFASYSIYP